MAATTSGISRKRKSMSTSWQVEEVPFSELDLRILPAADGDHASGQVDTDGGGAVPGEPGRGVPWAAADVSDRRALLGLLDEAGQQGPVKRFAGKLVAEAIRIFLSDRIIAAANEVATGARPHDDLLLIGACHAPTSPI
jgi:hypothetical protein